MVSAVLSGDHDIGDKMTLKELTPEEKRVILNKGTEAPFTGQYYKHKEAGTYTCKQCGAPLFRSTDKFESACGWPSFDDAIPGAVKQVPDADGSRTEIVCAICGGHLGHVFTGEGLTPKDTRHCVNSISLNFVQENKASQVDTTYFAGGCFWGAEYYLQKADGVISTRVGYMGGWKDNPSYEQICSGTTGHAETVEVVYDPARTNFETLARLFFEIHDPTQVDRQGPDVGEQYRSVVFYKDESQLLVSRKLIGLLEDKGFPIATELVKADKFWLAENYHQEYYNHTGKLPYCHGYQKRF
ncbi:MAG: bifunctional methionine sulfoxide reductase B/A protein [candidate division Zixibacteria bacterium]|nr:bifunctional methionine sulfoxide reductase B/A protein [candidate division Zixibacteria bacterium]